MEVELRRGRGVRGARDTTHGAEFNQVRLVS